MLKTSFLVLLALNIVLIAANAGIIGNGPNGTRDPQRLQKQVHPDLIHPIPTPIAGAADAAS